MYYVQAGGGSQTTAPIKPFGLAHEKSFSFEKLNVRASCAILSIPYPLRRKHSRRRHRHQQKLLKDTALSWSSIFLGESHVLQKSLLNYKAYLQTIEIIIDSKWVISKNSPYPSDNYIRKKTTN